MHWYNQLILIIKNKSCVLALAVGVAALTAVNGCGGGSGEDQASGEAQTATGPISKAAFIRKATAICDGLTNGLLEKAERQEAEGITQPTGEEAEIEGVRTVLVPSVEGEIDELRELGAPKGDEKKLNAFYSSLEEVMQGAEKNPQRFNSELSNFERPYAEAEKLATAYGIPTCSQP